MYGGVADALWQRYADSGAVTAVVRRVQTLLGSMKVSFISCCVVSYHSSSHDLFFCWIVSISLSLSRTLVHSVAERGCDNRSR
jgi:hypothetical protein